MQTHEQMIEAFLQGLAKKKLELMPLSDNILLASPLAPENEQPQGLEAVHHFLKTQVFPRAHLTGFTIHKHFHDGNETLTLWDAHYVSGKTVQIADYFVFDGKIALIKPYFDTKAFDLAITKA